MTDQPTAPTPDAGGLAADVPPPPPASPADDQVWASPRGEGIAAVGQGARPTWVLPVVTGVIGLVVGAGGMAAIGAGQDAAARTAQSAVLADAVETCDLAGDPWFVVADEGSTLTFDNKGDDEITGGSFENLVCLLDALDAPSSVRSHMGQTTSLDGRQEASWDGVAIAWSYHPDRGMDGVVTVETAD
ncbi:hypothetical protein DLJ96_06230 [Actinotalea fermentans ATCC 43279 = JCM 9966 = DSM 3133]|nr:hypothetical protein DLJ96_06230 [Actinotalea fermentans ATCC 43279 = JCM 9966 = DSM 3133]